MASQFTDVSVQRISVQQPAAAPEHAVRQQELTTQLATRPTTDQVDALLDAAAHTPASGGTSNSIETSVNGSQQITSEIRIPATVPQQDAATDLSETFGPVANGDTFSLQKVSVSNVVVIKRLTEDESLVHTGIEDTDYFLDAYSGELRILSDDLATGDGAELLVTYDCAQISQGPGIKVTASGVQADLGEGAHQLPTGRDVVELLSKRHRPVVLSQSNESIEGSIDDRQELKLEAKLAPDSGLTKTGGLKVDTEIIATKASVQSVEERVSEVESALEGLGGGTPTSVESTDSVEMTRDENGKITSNVLPDIGVKVTAAGVGVDFEVVATKETTDDHGQRLEAAETAITGLGNTKADASDVLTALEGKSNVGHGHAIADVANLQDELDGKAPVGHEHEEASEEQSGYLSSQDFKAIQCLKVVGDVEGAARELFPTMRQEIPEDGFQQNPEVHEAKSIQIGGEVGTNYTVRLKIRGVFETKAITGGTPVSGGKAIDGGTAAATPHNVATLTINAPAKVYHLNPVQGNGLEVLKWDYELEVVVTGGTTVTLAVDSIDGEHLNHSVQGPADVVPYPAVFEGQYMQVDAIEVDGYCLLKREFEDGVDRSDGTGGLDGDGGVGPTDGLEGANAQAVSVPDELRRVDFLPSLGADGDVYVIKISGEDIWIGGAFNRCGNVRSRGLAKLDGRLRYRFDFALGSGFSEPIKHLALYDTEAIAAGELDSLFRRAEVSRPIWKLDENGRAVEEFSSQFALSSDENPDRVIDIALLPSGKVAVITAKNLSVLSSTGTVIAQFEADNQLNAVFADGEDIVVSSHAYRAAAAPHRIDGQEVPRGLKKFKYISGSTWQLDPEWLDWNTAGTGAQSSCGRVVKSGGYYYVGNALTFYNSPNTSWNADSSGNLLLWSEAFSNAAWLEVGTPIIVSDDTNVAPDDTTTADTIADSDGSVQTYIYQDVEVPDNDERYAFSLFFRKDTDTTRFPALQMKFTGGATEVDVFAHLNTQTGVAAVFGNVGGGAGEVAVESIGSYWRVTLRASNNESGNDTLRCIIHPAYTSTYGGAAEALTGSIVAWGSQLRKTSWNSAYHKSEDEQLIPSDTGSNANRFRGLYVVSATDGAAHPTWECNITLSQAGHVIPVGVDAAGRVYIIGPVATINGTSVTPWRLYRLDADGAFDREYSIFNNQVLTAALTDCQRILCGGKFTHYGSRKASRLIMLNNDGTPAEFSDDELIIVSDTAPDVSENPCLKTKLWFDTSNPCGRMLKSFNDCSGEWEGTSNVGTLTTPLFTPASGAVDPESVSISVPGYPSAAIYFTTDGSTPTTSSAVYVGPIDMSGFTEPESITIKAFAVLENYVNSPIGTAIYTITAKLPDPVFTPGTGANTPVMVTLEVPGHEDATIYYTTDGSDPDLDSAVYDSAINVSTTTVIKAFAAKDDYRDSDTVSSSYAPASYGSGQLPTPVFTPTTGTQPFPVLVTITVPGHTSGLTIYYTVDGSTPNYSSSRYEGEPVELTTEGTAATIKAFATKATYSPSEVGSKVYTMETLAAPTINPSSGVQLVGTNVSVTHAVSGVSFYYTTNGDTPTTGSTLYSGPFPLTSLPMTVKAIAIKTGYQSSSVASKDYTQEQAHISNFSVTSGTVAMPINVSILSTTPGAQIYYTTNGDTTPDETDTLYTGPIEVTDDITIYARAFASGYVPSVVRGAFYTDNLIAPSISPENGSTIPDQTAVTLSQAGNPPGTQIYYTVDGSTPDSSKTLYTGPFLIMASMTVKAVCVKSGYDDSAVTSASYTKATVPTPTATPPAGAVFFPTNVALACSLAGSTIHYTTDGDTPTTADPVYSGPIEVAAAMTIKALGRKLGYNNSAVMSQAYTQAQAGTPSFSPVAGAYAFPFAVTISNSTPNDTIYYTIDGSDPDNTDFEYGAPRRITPLMTSNSQDGFVASASDDNADAYKAFDGDNGTEWHAATAFHQLNILLPKAERVTSYRMYTDRLMSWVLQGKRISDGLWVNIHTGGASPTPGFPIWVEYELGDAGWVGINTVPYREYRLNAGTSASSASIHELELYASGPTVDEDVTIKAIAIGSGWLDSNIASAAYTQAQVAPPVASPVAGGIPFPTNVALTCATSGATIHYTTNGDTPTTGSPVYSSPIAVSADTTIKAIAVRTGYLESAMLTAAYTQRQLIVTMTPTPPASASIVTLAADVAGSTIYYTVDGTDPDTSSYVYSGPIAVSGETTIKAFAKKTGYLDSSITSGTFN